MRVISTVNATILSISKYVLYDLCNSRPYLYNLQVISLPNLRIIDFGYGFTGSTHDSTAWEETRMVKEREIWMKEGEFIWADSAYPVRVPV